MNPLDAFLYGMPVVLMAGAGVTLFFARRAAKDIRSRAGLKPPAIRRTYLPLSSRRVVKPESRPSEERSRTMVH